MPKNNSETPDPIDIYVGQQLKIGRNNANVSQSELAKAICITFQQVQKYEKGTNRLSASRMCMAAEFLGMSVSDFFPPKYVNGKKTTGQIGLLRAHIAELENRLVTINGFSKIKQITPKEDRLV